MYAHVTLASITIVLATFAKAEPVRRYDVGNAVDSYTSEAGSYYTRATSEAASGYSVGLSAASAGVQEGFSDASTWLASHALAGVTSAGSVVATVTTVNGVAETIVSSVGGAAVTLAPSGAGVKSSFGGIQLTVAATPTSTTNAATNVHSVTLKTSPVLAAVVTVVGTTLMGAWLTY